MQNSQIVCSIKTLTNQKSSINYNLLFIMKFGFTHNIKTIYQNLEIFRLEIFKKQYQDPFFIQLNGL